MMIDATLDPSAHDPGEAGRSGGLSYLARWRALPWRSRGLILGMAAGLIAVGATGGVAAAGLWHTGPASFDAGLATTPISQTSTISGDRVALSGDVAEIFGNKFVITDGAARALVETGRAGEDMDLVSMGESVVVQGRFDHGFLHATAIRRAHGQIEELAPPPPGPKPARF